MAFALLVLVASSKPDGCADREEKLDYVWDVSWDLLCRGGGCDMLQCAEQEGASGGCCGSAEPNYYTCQARRGDRLLYTHCNQHYECLIAPTLQPERAP